MKEPAKEPTTEEIVKAAKENLVQMLFAASPSLASDYKNTIRHTGSLVSASMAYAYAKGLNDALKLLTKEVYNEKSVQTK